MANYVRSRKLEASLEKLLITKQVILGIAIEYGFEHLQSFIRAFKREFGVTSGELRKTGRIVKVKPPLRLFPSNQFGTGEIFGLEIVYVPGFYCVGKSYMIPEGQGYYLPARVA